MSFKSFASVASEQYEEVKRSLTLFPYFETWDDNVIDECCRLSLVKEYPEDSIILGSCPENNYMTFFVLEGICKIIHHLQVHVQVSSYGKTTYKLHKPSNSKSSNSEINNIEYTSMLFTEMHKFQEESVVEIVKDEILTEKTLKDEKINESLEEEVEEKEHFVEEIEKNENSTEKKNKREENSVLFSEEKNDYTDNSNKYGKTQDNSHTITQQDAKKMFELKKASQDKEGNCTNKVAETEGRINSEGECTQVNLDEKHPASMKEQSQPKPKADAVIRSKEINNVTQEILQEESKIIYEEDHHLKILEECKKKAKENMRSVGMYLTTDRPKDVKSFFVQVGLFYKGSCFGLEEHLKDTVVMSATKVKCLTIPRRFLYQHNPCNIWNRIRLFFSLHLPTEEQIFEYFSANRAWLKKKQKMSERISSLKKIPNYTLCSDIPYGIRLLQEL